MSEEMLSMGNENVILYAKWIDIYDINGDATVSILGLISIAQNYNMKNKQINWNPRFDFNKDGFVDIFDLASCSKRINTIQH